MRLTILGKLGDAAFALGAAHFSEMSDGEVTALPINRGKTLPDGIRLARDKIGGPARC